MGVRENIFRQKARGAFYCFAVFFLGLALAACSDEPPGPQPCNAAIGSSCAFASSGYDLQIELDSLQPSTEYVLVFLSQADIRKNLGKTSNVKIQSAFSSEALPRIEKRNRDFFAQSKGRPHQNTSTGDPRFGAESPGKNENIVRPDREFFIPSEFDSPEEIPHGFDSRAPSFIVQSPQGKAGSGPFNFPILDNPEALFTIRYNSKTIDFNDVGNQRDLKAIENCVRNVFPKALNVLGAPIYDLDDTPGIELLITPIAGGGGGTTAGLFAEVDRFSRNKGKDFGGSNKGEVLYLAKTPNTQFTCSTSVHEYQHLVSFDYKVLRKLHQPFDYNEMVQRNLEAEYLGINEGISHVFEELSEKDHDVNAKIYKFWKNPNTTTFDTLSVNKNLELNFQSRGANTLFQHFLIKKAGGRLSFDDEKTVNYLKTVVESDKTGFENLADYFGLNVLDLFKEFFQGLAQALYDENSADSFMPPVETAEIEGRAPVTRGIKIVNRDTPIEEMKMRLPKVHPLEFGMQDLEETQNFEVMPHGMIWLRFATPSEIRRGAKLKVSHSRNAFSFFLIPVRAEVR